MLSDGLDEVNIVKESTSDFFPSPKCLLLKLNYLYVSAN